MTKEGAAPVLRGFLIILRFFIIGYWNRLLPRQRRCNDGFLIFRGRNVVPCIMCPDIVLVSEKSYDNVSRLILTEATGIAYRDPKGGSPVPISCTDDVVFWVSIV